MSQPFSRQLFQPPNKMSTLLHMTNLCFLLMSQSMSVMAATSAKERNEFVKAMHSSLNTNANKHHNYRKLQSFESLTRTMNLEQSSTLREKIIKKATFVPPTSLKNEDLSLTDRHLSSSSSSSSSSYSTATEWSNSFNFDPSHYSLSYRRCAQVRQFDDQVAANEDSTSVFKTEHFVVFRLCPSKTCDPYAKTIDAQEEQTNSTAGDDMYENFEAYMEYRQNKYAQYSDDSLNQQAQTAYAEQKKKYKVGGANGEGCSTNYGEYMIELEDYLQIMSDYMDERFSTYCEFCEECMYVVYKNWAQNQGRTLIDITDNGWQDIDINRELGGTCDQYDTCRYYANMCKNGLDTDITSYFQCTFVKNANVYVGPHCADDGSTITLGMYTDKYCNEFMGKDVNAATFLGEVDQEAIDTYASGSMTNLMPEGYQEYFFESYGGWESMCIPCRESQFLFNSLTDDDYSSVNELCWNLYKSSAKCNQNIKNYVARSKLSGQRMQLSCAFINSVVMGKYDEAGFLTMAESPLAKAGFLRNNTYYEAALPYLSRVSSLQIFGLCASMAACLALGLWSLALHRSLTKKGGWRPKRFMNKNTSYNVAVNAARQESGIGMARGQSYVPY